MHRRLIGSAVGRRGGRRSGRITEAHAIAADSTHGRRLSRAVALLLALAASLGGFASLAAADGDPASDVLVTQTLFLPSDAGVPASQQAQLTTLLAAARRAGMKLRVAVIASPTDLGSVGLLWRQPQLYARFLGKELTLLYRGTLLIVMPNGFGLSLSGGEGATSSALPAASMPASAGLGRAAITAVASLARAAGHPLSVPGADTAAPSARGSSDTLKWLVVAGGVLVLALAWAASLRARPLALRRRRRRGR